jgi:hypothetical protein
MKRLGRVNTTWTASLAYAVGVIATDGNLSSDGRHINVTSKDLDLVLTMRSILGLQNKIGKKARGGSGEKKYFVLQFGDISFYEFLLSIGLTPVKSKTLKKLSVPERYFPDFLRGCIDGDGSIGAYKHPESAVLQLRLRLVSASPDFLLSILNSIQTLFDIQGGYICKPKNTSVSTLAFGMQDSRKILSLMYYDKSVPALERKRAKTMMLLQGE